MSREQRTEYTIMSSKRPRVWIYLLIAALCYVTYHDYQVSKQLVHIKPLYQEKTNAAFEILLWQAPSVIPLAESLEAIAARSDKDSKTVELIEQTKLQATRWESALGNLIEFSDDYSDNADVQVMTNNSIMTSEKQRDMLHLAFNAKISLVLYTVGETALDDGSRRVLTAYAKELRSLEETLSELKESAKQYPSSSDIHSAYMEYLKKQLLDQLRPHLEQLKQLQNDYQYNKYNTLK